MCFEKGEKEKEKSRTAQKHGRSRDRPRLFYLVDFFPFLYFFLICAKVARVAQKWARYGYFDRRYLGGLDTALVSETLAHAARHPSFFFFFHFYTLSHSPLVESGNRVWQVGEKKTHMQMAPPWFKENAVGPQGENGQQRPECVFPSVFPRLRRSPTFAATRFAHDERKKGERKTGKKKRV